MKSNLKYIFIGVACVSVLFIIIQSTKSHSQLESLRASQPSSVSDSPGSINHNSGDISNSATQINPSEVDLSYSSTSYNDDEFGFKKTVFKNKKNVVSEGANTVLVLSSIGSSDAYGPSRGIKDFIETISSLQYDHNIMSLAFLAPNEEEYKKFISFFHNYFHDLIELKKSDTDSTKKYFAKVTILCASFLEKEFSTINRNNRHDDAVQRLRRRSIARARNFVLLNSMENEKYTLFIDSDIVKFESSNMLSLFIKSTKDIIVPRIKLNDDQNDYDKNSWKGTRTVPTKEQYQMMDNNDWDHWDYVPKDVPGKMLHFNNYLDSIKSNPANDQTKKPDHTIELDSVGGAVLFSKSIVYRQGVSFPPSYIIGTTWQRFEGYDGIETEGLCYMARPLGYKCWGMPNVVATHASS